MGRKWCKCFAGNVKCYLLTVSFCRGAEEGPFPAHIVGVYGKPAPHPAYTVKALEFRKIWSSWQTGLH